MGKHTVPVMGKGHKERKLFIPETLKLVWREYVSSPDRYTTSDWLFTGQRGPITRQTVHTMIKYYAGQARMNKARAHAHSFRHGLGVALDEAGFSQADIADILGHKDINTTRIYQRKTESELLKKINMALQQ